MNLQHQHPPDPATALACVGSNTLAADVGASIDPAPDRGRLSIGIFILT